MRLNADSPAAAQKRDARFFRSLLLLAAVVSVAVGAFWWALTLRQVAEPIVQLRDAGEEWVVGSNGRINFPRKLPEPLQQLVATTLRTGKLSIPDEIRTLAAPPVESEPQFRSLAPVATVVRDARPNFRWTAAANATAYRVTVVDAQERGSVASREVSAPATEWAPSIHSRWAEITSGRSRPCAMARSWRRQLQFASAFWIKPRPGN